MNEQEFRMDELKRFLAWVSTSTAYAGVLFGDLEFIGADQRDFVNELYKNKFYTILIIYLMKFDSTLHDITFKFIMDYVLSDLDENMLEEIMQRVNIGIDQWRSDFTDLGANDSRTDDSGGEMKE